MIRLSSRIFNSRYVKDEANLITEPLIEELIHRYKEAHPYSQFFICKMIDGRIVGSACTTVGSHPVEFEFEKECKAYLGNSEANQHITVNYGSLTFIDKEYLQTNGYDSSTSTKLWKQLLKRATEKISTMEHSVYFSHPQKQAFYAFKKALGMPWEQIGDEVKWLMIQLLYLR